MALTLEEAKNLEIGQVLYHTTHRNADGTPLRYRTTGKPKTWKSMPERVQVPLKHGLYGKGDYLTERSLDLLCLREWEATGEKITFKKIGGRVALYYEVIFGKQKIPYKKKYKDRKIGEVYKNAVIGCWFNNQEAYRYKTRKDAAIGLLDAMLD